MRSLEFGVASSLGSPPFVTRLHLVAVTRSTQFINTCSCFSFDRSCEHLDYFGERNSRRKKLWRRWRIWSWRQASAGAASKSCNPTRRKSSARRPRRPPWRNGTQILTISNNRYAWLDVAWIELDWSGACMFRLCVCEGLGFEVSLFCHLIMCFCLILCIVNWRFPYSCLGGELRLWSMLEYPSFTRTDLRFALDILGGLGRGMVSEWVEWMSA